jgi:transcriptional regulator with XRE-family HTH domain
MQTTRKERSGAVAKPASKPGASTHKTGTRAVSRRKKAARDGGGQGAAAPNVGAYLRLLRQERGLSLAELATRCGVSRAMISQIEQGRSSPSISLGWKLANGLGVPFGALLGEPTEGDFVVQRKPEVREVFSADKSMRSRALFPSGDRRAPELYELLLRPGGIEDAHAHGLGTRELLYVESGRLVLSCAGQQIALDAGDSLFFRADQPHRYENPGSHDTRIYLVMCYPQRSE